MPSFRLRLLLVACTTIASLALGAEPKVGESSFGEKQYVEYVAGDLPIVLTAPHGGRLKPEEIPDRAKGVVQMDANTQELARAVADEFFTQTGHRAHLVVCRLHRAKLDCNREIVEAAQGSAVAEKAWGEYHGFIDRAIDAEIGRAGKVFTVDLHGHAHKDQRLELGYLHSEKTLGQPDEVLNSAKVVQEGSLREIAKYTKLAYVDVLCGPRSLGARLQAAGYPCTPSPEKPVPGVPYFDGGYTVRRHVAAGRPIAGLQIECNSVGVRDTEENRVKFVKALVKVLREYLPAEYGLKVPAR